MKTIDERLKLEILLEKPRLPRASREWGGADVVISKKQPTKNESGGFYPVPQGYNPGI